jgi:hypothetical protein
LKKAPVAKPGPFAFIAGYRIINKKLIVRPAAGRAEWIPAFAAVIGADGSNDGFARAANGKAMSP